MLTWHDGFEFLARERRLPSDDLCEKIAAEKIAQHLELSGYLIGQKPPRRAHSTRLQDSVPLLL